MRLEKVSHFCTVILKCSNLWYKARKHTTICVIGWGGCRMGENKMMMSSSSLSKYVVLWMERQVFTRKFVRLGKK